MRNRLIRVLLFTLALTLLAVSYCAFAYADGEVAVVAPATEAGGPHGSHGFDVIGSAGGGRISATVGGAGFRTWMRIGEGQALLFENNGNFYLGGVYETEGVSAVLTSEAGFDGKAAIVTYTVTNGSDAAAVVRIGSCGKTQVGADAAAPVYRRADGFVSESGNLSLMVFASGHPFSGAYFNADSTVNRLFYLDQDCDMSWYWYLYLQPGQTVSRSVAIALGEQRRCSVFLDPNGGADIGSDTGARQERLAIGGAAYKLPPAPYERGDFIFLGWAVDKEAKYPNYLNEGVIPASELYDNLTLYAVWKDKRLQEIEAEDFSVPFGDPAQIPATSTDGRLSYSVSAGADVISVDEQGRITTLKTGSAKVTITAAATNESKETTKDIIVTVVPKQLDRAMLTLTPETLPFTGEAVRPTVSVANGERPMLRGTDYEIDASSVLAATALGEYRVTIEGLGNYAGSVSAAWKIAKSTPEVRVSPFSGTYDGTAHPLLTVDAHTGGTLQFSLDRNGPYTEAVPEATDAGSYTVWYRVVGNEFFLDASPASCSAEIARRTVTVSGIRAENKVYDASSTARLLLDRAAITGLCRGDSVELRSAEGRFADADAGQDKRVSISAITLGGADAGNYMLDPQQQLEVTASITPRPVTIRAKDQQIALYGDIAQGTDQVTVDGLCSYDMLRSVTLSKPQSLSESGTGSITPARAVIVRSGSTQETTKNYAITYVPGTLRAEQRELTLTWTDTEFVYDGKSHAPKAAVSGMLYGEALTVNVTGSKVAANPQGEEYVATAVSLSGTNAIYYKLPEEATQIFTIAPRPITIQAKDQTVALEGSAVSGLEMVTIIGSGLGDDDELQSVMLTSSSTAKTTNTGSITPSDAVIVRKGSSQRTESNYAITYVPGTMLVEPHELTLTWTETEFVYDGKPHVPKAIVSGTLHGEDLTVTVSGAKTDVNPKDGEYTATAESLSGTNADNYKLPEEATQTFIIGPRPITIQAKDQENSLDEDIVKGIDQVTIAGSGLGDHDELQTILLVPSTKTGKITPSRAVIVHSGSSQVATGNYIITYLPGTLRAKQQRELTLTWTDTEFVYNGKSHHPNVTISGMNSGDDLTVKVTGSQTAANPEGEEYVATASDLTGTNAIYYKLPADATQTFVIKPRSLEEDEITVEYRPDDEFAVIGPVPNDGKAYGFKSVIVRDGTRMLRKDVDYTLKSEYSTIYGPHTLRITGKGNYEGSLAREWTMIGDGLVSASVDIKNGAATIYWTNASEELADALLDDEDRLAREEYGTPTDVYLQIRPAVTPSGISAKAGQIGEKVAVSYDISLYKRIGNDSTIIRDTGGRRISVTLDIPDELRKAPLGYYRSFSLIHLHDGTAEVLAQGTGRSFSFSTTTFSPYAISYRDIKLPPGASPPTGDAARIPLWGTLLLLSVCGLLCLVPKTRKE